MSAAPSPSPSPESLIADYTPLARRIAYGYQSLNQEDRMQEAMLGLVIAAARYDPSRGQFASFAGTIIRNRLNQMYQRERFTYHLLDDIHGQTETGFADVETVQTLTVLPDPERKMVALLANDTSQRECAKQLGVSQASISRSMSRLRQDLT